MQPRFNIADPSGRVIYTNLLRAPHGYDWGDGYGSVSDTLIAVERWSVIPA